MASGNDYLIQDAARAMATETPVAVVCRAVPGRAEPDGFRYLDFHLEVGEGFTAPSALDRYARMAAESLRRLDAHSVVVLQPAELVPVLKMHAPTCRILLLASSHHLYRADDYYGYGALSHQQAQDTLSAADVVLTVSAFLSNCIAHVHPAFAEKLAVLPQGVNDEYFQVERGRGRGPRVLYVGRLEEAKGAGVLAEAFGALHSKYPEATLTFVGDQYGPGPDDFVHQLRRAVDAQPFSAAVHLAGWAPRSALPSVYAQADIFVHPAVWDESFASTVLEAKASAVPVVATDTGGTAEAVAPDRGGLLVAPGDPAAISAALLAIAGDTTFANQLGTAGRADASAHYTWARFTQGIRKHTRR
jgi:glycosyltransferase involved in cell wall biosynthesis